MGKRGIRLLQLFIGLPWVSTYSAALTAQKQVEQGLASRPSSSGTMTVITARLNDIEKELGEAKKARGPEDRATLRLQLADLDVAIAKARKLARDAGVVMEADIASFHAISDSYEESRRRLKLLEEEQSAGYSFRKLSPTCCPACESGFDIEIAEKSASDASCALCKNDLPATDPEADENQITLLKKQVGELVKCSEGPTQKIGR